MRALVIDDSRTMRRIIAGVLRSLGFETLEAADGREALDILESGVEVDLACIDWNMPVMNGLEFVVAVRANRAWREVTLMMVTTESEHGQIVRALAAGAHEYLIKPFTADAIREKLAAPRPRRVGGLRVSAGLDLATVGGDDPLLTIAAELFAAMIDPESTTLREWPGVAPEFVEPTYAWVDLGGEMPGRVLLTTERSTATRISRSLLGFGPDEAVEHADFVDAYGEVANVLGGNVKSLVPDPGALTLPQVSHSVPEGPVRDLVHEVAIDWRGELLRIAVWSLP